MKCPHCDKQIVIICGQQVTERWVLTIDGTPDPIRLIYDVPTLPEAMKLFDKTYAGTNVVSVWKEMIVR